MKTSSSILFHLKSLPIGFWLLNLIQMIEKSAYVVVLLQMPIYLSQKDIAGGLYLSQSSKGYIFFAWALVQRLTPVFTGGYTDKIGYKKTLYYSFTVIVISYLVLGLSSSLWLFLLGIMLLGFGSGLFLPAIQAAMSQNMNKENESTAWGAYFMLLNFGVFFSPILSIYFKNISWEWVFYGSAGIFLVNYILLFFIKIENIANIPVSSKVLKEVFANFLSKKVLFFILLMSGFVIIYMQFYETFPNFFFDWVDTSSIAEMFGAASTLTMESTRGLMLSYESIRIVNSGLIIIFVLPISWLASKIFRLNAIVIGVLLTTVGLLFCGISDLGLMSFAGIIIYTFGELIVNPKFTEHMNSFGSQKNKAAYMSYLNISFAIGLGGGALLGGYIYNYFGEKATLASNYLKDNYNITNVELTESMNLLVEKTGLDYSAATKLLWDTYNPWTIWFPFVLIGIISIFGMLIYKKRFYK